MSDSLSSAPAVEEGESSVDDPNAATGNDGSQDEVLLGAIDIVEAFTALRQELKLQIRSGREIQQTLSSTMTRIEQMVAQQPKAATPAAIPDDSRRLAEALAEMEESVQRVIESLAEQESEFSVQNMAHQNLAQPKAKSAHSGNPPESLEDLVRGAPWIVRHLAKSFLKKLGVSIDLQSAKLKHAEAMRATTDQVLALLLQRVRRLMLQCELQRVDVLHKPFDAESMHAVDLVDSPSTPKAHVAEQIRPAYLWRGRVLRYADVRLAR